MVSEGRFAQIFKVANDQRNILTSNVFHTFNQSIRLTKTGMSFRIMVNKR